MAPATLFGSVVRNAKMSVVISPSFTFRTEVQRVQTPAKKASGRVSSNTNQTGGCVPSGSASFSEKLVKGTTHRLSTPSQHLQCGDFTLRTLVLKRLGTETGRVRTKTFGRWFALPRNVGRGAFDF
jgi:hypothetical protein